MHPQPKSKQPNQNYKRLGGSHKANFWRNLIQVFRAKKRDSEGAIRRTFGGTYKSIKQPTGTGTKNQTPMKQFFNKQTMWCESKDPRLKQACNILASEELKNFVCVAVVCLIAVNELTYLKDPFMKCMGFFQKKINSLRRIKKTPALVPQACLLKLDSRVDIERWVNQARLFVQDFDEGRIAEVVMM